MSKTFDITKDMPRITWITYCDIKLKAGDDAVLLYIEFLRMANTQNTNQPWATNSYMKDNLKWSLKRIKDARAKLISLGYLETIPPIWNKKEQKFNKNYTKVNKIISAKKLQENALLSGSKTEPVNAGSILGLVAKQTHKCLKDTDTKCLKDNNLERDIEEKKSKDLKQTHGEQNMGYDTNIARQTVLPQTITNLTETKTLARKMRNFAVEKALENNKTLHGAEGSALLKFLDKKIETLVKDGSSLEEAETALEIAIKKFYNEWIYSEIYIEHPFGLVPTLKTQWANLTS